MAMNRPGLDAPERESAAGKSVTAISSLYLHSKSQARPLRIGVMVDDIKLLRVFRQILIDIECSDFARLGLVVLNRHPMYAPT